MNSGVSIIICCHNSEQRISTTLKALLPQQGTEGISWEVILVDNASGDATVSVARSCWPADFKVPLKIVKEERLGLSNARERGLAEAAYEIVSFIDDDNRVCSDWVKRVSSLFAGHPDLGVVGGPSLPDYEVPPPVWIEEIQSFYAVGEQHQREGDITDSTGSLLWGAGMTLRKNAYVQLRRDGFAFECSGRRGKRLTAGEDSELCQALKASGWRFRYDKNLRLTHFIPAGRMNWGYARRLMKGIGGSSAVLNAYRIALSRSSPVRISEGWFRESWLVQTCKSVSGAWKTFLASPVQCLRGEEGCLQALKWDREVGMLLIQLSLFGRYRKLVMRLRMAEWNRKGVHVPQSA